MEQEQITVLGVGNILMQDEGFGVRVVEDLQQCCAFPSHVQVLDGGTLGMELLRFLTQTDRLVIVDAVNGSQPHGSLYEFSGAEVRAYFKEKVSMHELGVQDVLAALDLLERPVRELVVLGVQPAVVDVGLELSPTVAECVVPVREKVLAWLRRWGTEVTVV
ncbi:MAG TPA: HyaD/HybD family hydrogenase maturation endopeptidase [Patescibacteria group bacterium]|nr:HyaD/HybD family hydrogenase maturation endopeptidase [Patescibacteria group bacterium]